MKKLFALICVLIISLFMISGCQNQDAQSNVPSQEVKQAAPAETQTTSSGSETSANTQVTGSVIAKLSDVPSGAMKKFTFNGEEAILVNFNGDVKAYVNKCTHQQLAFDENSLKSDKIQCPWHGATFNPTSGSYEGHANGQNYGLAGLTMVNIKVENGNIYTV